MPLTMAAKGEENTIKRISGKPETVRLLENLGIVAGGIVTVIDCMCGSVIVNVENNRVAVSERIAARIMV